MPDHPQRIPITREAPDGQLTDGTAELIGPAILRDLTEGASMTNPTPLEALAQVHAALPANPALDSDLQRAERIVVASAPVLGLGGPEAVVPLGDSTDTVEWFLAETATGKVLDRWTEPGDKSEGAQ